MQLLRYSAGWRRSRSIRFERRLAAQRIKLRLDAEPHDPRISDRVRIQKQLERTLAFAEMQMNQRQLIRRDVAVHRQLGQTVQHCARIFLSSGGGVRCAERSDVKRAAARKFQRFLCGFDRFVEVARVPE